MSLQSSGVRAATILAALLAVGSRAAAQDQQFGLDRSSLRAGQVRLAEAVEAAVKASGGDPDTQTIHLVFAFKTSYFELDPIKARAAREVASGLVRDLAVAGDRVTARAFEFGLWPHLPEGQRTLVLAGSRPEDKAAVDGLWPTSPREGSQGGHDTERAAVELGEELGDAGNAVIVMLTNAAAGQGAPGERLLGGDAPAYQDFLESWRRVPGTRDGATLTIPFAVRLPEGEANPRAVGGVLTDEIQAVVFAPRTFAGAALGGLTRSERLAAPEPVPVEPERAGGSRLGWLLALLALFAAGFALVRFVLPAITGGGRGRWELEVAGSRFDLAGTPPGRAVAVLAGPGFTNEVGDPVVVVPKAPPVSFGRVVRTGRGVQVESAGGPLELKEFDGSTVGGPVVVRTDPNAPEHTVVFEGSILGASGVLRHVAVSVRFSLMRGEG